MDAHDEAADQLPGTLIGLGRLVERRANAAVRDHGITAAQFLVLAYLAEHPGASRSQLGRALQVSPQGAGGVVERLVAGGLLHRTRPREGHPVELSLTPNGNDVLDRSVPAVSAVTDEILGLFRPSHQPAFSGMVQHVLARLSPLAATSPPGCAAADRHPDNAVGVAR